MWKLIDVMNGWRALDELYVLTSVGAGTRTALEYPALRRTTVVSNSADSSGCNGPNIQFTFLRLI